MTTAWDLILPRGLWRRLREHLFPGDGGEHGAVIAAGVARTPTGGRLLAREVIFARDGVDYVPGERGYRMLTADFVRDSIISCRNEELAYLAVHCHGGTNHVAFSPDDVASHERGYPALLDISEGQIVGGLVFAHHAVAGDLWFPNGDRITLRRAVLVGGTRHTLTPEATWPDARPDPRFDRQSRLFGQTGQSVLSDLTVAVVGAGGVGSLAVELLARLGVGHLLVIDPDRVEASNLSRLVDATRLDAMSWFTGLDRPEWVRAIGRRFAAPKVRVARRVARRANPSTTFDAMQRDVTEQDVALALTAVDYIFLAADSMQARLVVNAIAHQYLIPMVQIGAKVRARGDTGELLEVYSVARPVTPESGCLWCNGLIPPGRLAAEAYTEDERGAQRYVDDPTVVAPSVITLNAMATSWAVNEFMCMMTGLPRPYDGSAYVEFWPQSGEVRRGRPRRDNDCPECGVDASSRRARGDSRRLPTRSR